MLFEAVIELLGEGSLLGVTAFVLALISIGFDVTTFTCFVLSGVRGSCEGSVAIFP